MAETHLVMFEARWHGFAKWRIEEHHQHESWTGWTVVTTLEEGWTRRGRNASYVETVVSCG